AIAVGGNYPKDIMAGRQVRVIGSPAITGINPVSVQAVQFVFEINLSGVDEAQPSVMDFEALFAGSDNNTRTGIDNVAVNDSPLDHHRRRLSVQWNGFGIDPYNAVQSREPELAVPGLYSSRLAPAIAFRVQHSILHAV